MLDHTPDPESFEGRNNGDLLRRVHLRQEERLLDRERKLVSEKENVLNTTRIYDEFEEFTRVLYEAKSLEFVKSWKKLALSIRVLMRKATNMTH